MGDVDLRRYGGLNGINGEGKRGPLAQRGPSVGPMGRRERRLAYVFLLPALLLIGSLYILPTIVTFLASFQPAETDPNVVQVLSLSSLQHLSLNNYIRSFRDAVWLKATLNTGVYVLAVLVGGMSFSMVTALVLSQPFRGRGLLRALVLVPWAVPPIVNGTMWGLVYHADIGAMNGILRQVGLIHQDLLWLAEPQLAKVAVVSATVWRLTPFMTLLILSGLQTIPKEIQESAQVDGANAMQRFLHITLPSIRMVLLTAGTLLIVWVTKAFDEIWALTRGGPSNATMVMNLWIYRQAFEFLRGGYGSALAYILVLVTSAVVAANFLIRRNEEV